MRTENQEGISIHISRSSITTAVNKTGSWRFVRPKYDEKTAPCNAACPAGEDIARIEMLAGQGSFKAAVETILFENPFPAVCGRVCFHPCETVCNRAELDDPVAIHRLERFLGDRAISDGTKLSLDKLPDKGKKICIVGAGPAGLAAGYFLARLGYACDVFEAAPEPGGILRWGIPRYRLPESALMPEIERIKSLGVNIYCNTPVDRQFLEQTQSKYDAAFIGCGHGRSIRMRIPGEEIAFDGLEFLRRLRREAVVDIEGTAAVIGGGNTAIDVARALIRLGAKAIVVYRRRKEDMPAFESEAAMAVAEGVKIMELVAPVGIEVDGGGPILTLQKMKVGDRETVGGRTQVVPDGETTRRLRVDTIFTAIGAGASESWQLPAAENSLSLSHCTFTIHRQPTVFGGDLTNSVKSVADAVASGKQAAMVLDTYFQKGRDAVAERLVACQVANGPALSMESYLGVAPSVRNSRIVVYDQINIDYFAKSPRLPGVFLPENDRIQSFAEVEATLTEAQAQKEIARCFNCGICNACQICRVFCPETAVHFKDARRQVDLDYCKGCGICVIECPRNAMALEEEP